MENQELKFGAISLIGIWTHLIFNFSVATLPHITKSKGYSQIYIKPRIQSQPDQKVEVSDK